MSSAGWRPVVSIRRWPDQAEHSLTNYVRSWPIYDTTSQAVLEAVRGVQRYHFTYWDAPIWATAKLNDTLTILAEDLPSNNLIEGVRSVNPFGSDFHLSVLG